MLQICKYDQPKDAASLATSLPLNANPSSLSPPLSITPVAAPIHSSMISLSTPTTFSYSTKPVSLQSAAISMEQLTPMASATPVTFVMSSSSGGPVMTTQLSSNLNSTNSPANLPTASSLISLPANMAGTASNALFAARGAGGRMVTPTSPAASRGIVRMRAQTPTVINTIRTSSTGPSIIKSTATVANLGGMNALAAAAAATQKIQTPTSTVGTPTVRFIGPGASQGAVNTTPIKVAGVGGTMQTVRILNPSQAMLRGALPQGSNVKQILVQQKPGGGLTATGAGGQQMFTMLKTNQGQVLTSAQVQKVVQSGATLQGTVGGSAKPGSNIIKLVAAPGGQLTGNATILNSSQQQIMVPGSSGNIMINKQQIAYDANNKPTFVLRPGTAVATRPGVGGGQTQYVVVTQASALRNFQGIGTTMAGTTASTMAMAGGQAMKMIMVTSPGTTTASGKPITIFSGNTAQTKNVALSTAGTKQTIITSTGQILTLPQGMIGQQVRAKRAKESRSMDYG